MLFKATVLFASSTLAALVPPSQDPFYQPTGDWQSQAPGTILAHRSVPNPIQNATYSAAYQLLYRTVDALQNPLAAVTTIIIPTEPDYTKLLSYQVTYDTPDVDCSPSYAIQAGPPVLSDPGFTYPLIYGWIVNAPDYEGPNAAFTNGPISGQATLDSIRAAIASAAFTNISHSPTIALWGYSGGALASEWAAELHASYAPELNISATAIGGTTPNVTNVALHVNNKSSSGLLPSAILGIAAAYPNVTTLLNESFVSAADQANFWSVKQKCLSQVDATESDIDMFSYFKQGSRILTDPQVDFAITDGGIMGTHGIPLRSNKFYWYKTTEDEVSPIADTDALVEKYCQAGVNIRYVKDNFGTHAQEAVTGGLGAFAFLTEIMGGLSMPDGCFVETRNTSGDVIASSTIAATLTASATSSGSAGSASVTASSSVSASASLTVSALVTGSNPTSTSAGLSPTSPGLSSASSNTATNSSSTPSSSSTSLPSSSMRTYTGAASREQRQPLLVIIGILAGLVALVASFSDVALGGRLGVVYFA